MTDSSSKRPKTGGRKKGTPNRTTKSVREKLAEVTSTYYNSREFAEDLKTLEPKDRVTVMEKLTSYVVPKMQSTTIDATVETRKTIEDRLIELSQID